MSIPKKKGRFDVIYEPGVAFGGWQFRATSNGEIVNLQQMSPDESKYKIVARISKSQWDRFVETVDLFSPSNRSNPGLISDYISELVQWP